MRFFFLSVYMYMGYGQIDRYDLFSNSKPLNMYEERFWNKYDENKIPTGFEQFDPLFDGI